MHGDQARPVALAPPDSEGRVLAVQGEVRDFHGDGLGDPEARPPLEQHEQRGPGSRGQANERVDLVLLQVLGEGCDRRRCGLLHGAAFSPATPALPRS